MQVCKKFGATTIIRPTEIPEWQNDNNKAKITATYVDGNLKVSGSFEVNHIGAVTPGVGAATSCVKSYPDETPDDEKGVKNCCKMPGYWEGGIVTYLGKQDVWVKTGSDKFCLDEIESYQKHCNDFCANISETPTP